MSIQNEITRITNKRDQSFTKVASKGVTVPSGSTIDDLPDLIDSIKTYDVYTITKNLSDVTTNNDDTEVIANGSFYMNLVPGPGKVIDSITVTMGGVDITDQVFTPGVGQKVVSANGTYNASSDSFSGYNQVVVDVPHSGITPTGTKDISINANGTTIEDVTNYASAQITVAVPQPSGSTTVTDNGTYNIAQYASVVVAIPSASGVSF